MSDTFRDILIQQRITNRLLVLMLRKPQQELIEALAGLGASDAEIAEVVGTTPATVATTAWRKGRKAGSRARPDSPQADASGEAAAKTADAPEVKR